MQEPEQNQQNDFMIERIKERPVNRRKLIRRTLVTASMAVIFGLIACVTFLVLEPVISNWLNPEEEPAPIVFPEDQEEMSPEEMLADNIPPEEPPEGPPEVTLEEEQIQEILAGVELNKENYKQIYSALSEYVNELNHSMVTVTGVSSNVDWFNNVEKSMQQSSGVIIADNGRELLILADYTPLRKAESLTLTFSFLDASVNALQGYQIPAVLKSLDTVTNFAVISVNLADIPAEVLEEGGMTIASLGSSNARNIVGMPIVALGSPMGTSGSVGYGMITAVTSQYQYADTNYKFLQTNIFGSQSAGGVFFDLQGQIVGVITSHKTGNDLRNVVCGYGITELKKRIEKMSNGVPVAYMGISGMDVTTEAHEELGVPYGAFVRDIDMDSPAMQAGIQKGDVLTVMGEYDIRSYSEYINALMATDAGSTVEFTVMRAAQGEYREMMFQVVLGER